MLCCQLKLGDSLWFLRSAAQHQDTFLEIWYWDNSFRFNFSMFSYLGFALWLGSVVPGKIKMVSVCFHSPH